MKTILNWFKTTDQRVLDLEAQLNAAKREIAVLEAENATMAKVIARDRARVEAETAIHNRQRANAESTTDDQQFDQSVRRFSA